jgi:hypothetical protein
LVDDGGEAVRRGSHRPGWAAVGEMKLRKKMKL